jgi:hypothetical protein
VHNKFGSSINSANDSVQAAGVNSISGDGLGRLESTKNGGWRPARVFVGGDVSARIDDRWRSSSSTSQIPWRHWLALRLSPTAGGKSFASRWLLCAPGLLSNREGIAGGKLPTEESGDAKLHGLSPRRHPCAGVGGCAQEKEEVARGGLKAGEEQGRRRPWRRATVEVRRRPRRGVAGAARIPELHLDAPLLDALRAAREEGQGMGRAPTAPHQPTLLTLRWERVARRRGRKATRSERSRAGEGRGGGGAAEQACCPSLTAPACPVEIRPKMKGRSGADRRRARREMKGNFCLPVVGDTFFACPSWLLCARHMDKCLSYFAMACWS